MIVAAAYWGEAPNAGINAPMKLRVAELLARKGTSQTHMANEIGVTQSTVSKWCSGAATPPNKKIPLIADYFEVDPLELLPDDVISPEVRAILIKSRQLGESDIHVVEQLIDALANRSAA